MFNTYMTRYIRLTKYQRKVMYKMMQNTLREILQPIESILKMSGLDKDTIVTIVMKMAQSENECGLLKLPYILKVKQKM